MTKITASKKTSGQVIAGTERPLRGRVITHGDHRLAMAFGILATLPGNEITIDDPDCAIVSFPGFWSQLATVTDSERTHRNQAPAA